MRVLSFIVSLLLASLLLAGTAFAQAPGVVYTPTQKQLDATTYLNAEVVRVDTLSNTITFKSESGDSVLTVAGPAMDHLGRLRRGDDVILGYRLDPRGVRVVTAILAGETAEGRLQTASSVSFTIPSLPAPTTATTLNMVLPQPMAPPPVEGTPVGPSRELATRDFDNSMRLLAMKANEIDLHWTAYRGTCMGTPTTAPEIDRARVGSNLDREWFVLLGADVPAPADDNCRQLLTDLRRMVDDWEDQMTRAEDTGRAHDVLPGTMREIRERYRVEF